MTVRFVAVEATPIQAFAQMERPSTDLSGSSVVADGVLESPMSQMSLSRSDASSPKIRSSIAMLIIRMKSFTLCVSGACALVAFYKAADLFTVVQDQIKVEVPRGTQSHRELEQFGLYFPDFVGADTESLLLTCGACESLVEGGAAAVVERLVVAMNRTVHTLNATAGVGYFSAVSCYYDVSKVVNPNPFLSDGGRAMLYQWRWNVPEAQIDEANAFSLEIFNRALELSQEEDAREFQLDIKAGGPFATKRDKTEAVRRDCIDHALMFLPFGIMILGWKVGSVTLSLIPFITATVSLASSFAIVSITGKFVVINSFAPGLMTFFTMALSVDYSLFFLTRYAEERRAGATWKPAVEAMLVNSGEVVLVSGTVISIASLSGILLPGSGFFGVGLAVSTACTSCMVWNVVLIPAIIASNPRFFDRCSSWNSGKRNLGQTEEIGLTRMASFIEASPDLMEQQLMRSPVFWWGSIITVWPINMIVVISVLFLSLPLTLVFARSIPSMDMALVEPRGAPSTIANARIAELFADGAGCPSPVMVLMKPKPGINCPGTVTNNAFFASSCALAKRIVASTNGTAYELTAKNIWGVTINPEGMKMASPTVECLPWSSGHLHLHPDALKYLTGQGIFNEIEIKMRKYYMKAWDMLVGKHEDAILLGIFPTQDATTAEGYGLIVAVRKLLSEFRDGEGTDVCGAEGYMLSEPSMVSDFKDATLAALPVALYCTAGFALVMVGLLFRAAFLPLKLFFTVVMPIFCAYGTCVLVYQEGWLNWTKMDAFMQDSGLLWQIPVGSCTMLFGLGLDYDIVVFKRIRDLRMEGYENRDAIRLGLASTYPTILTAGIIFVLEFSGAIMSSVPNNNQMGMSVAVCVLFDMILVQGAFCPALLSIGTDQNWWPYRMPPAHRKLMSLRDLSELNTGEASEEGPLLGGDEGRSSRTSGPKGSSAELSYRKGDKVQIWSTSQEQWFDGELIGAFEEDCFFEGYAIKAGAIKVRSIMGTKFVSADRVKDVVRKRLAYAKGEKVQLWSASKKQWLDGKVVEAFDDDSFTAEGHAVKRGTLKVAFSTGSKWVKPDEVEQSIRKRTATFGDA